MSDINVTPQFVLAGDATYTVSNGNGVHYTLHVYMSQPSEKYPSPGWFMKVKTGPDASDWAYLGQLRGVDNPMGPELVSTRRTRYKKDTQLWRVAQWSLQVIWQRATYTPPAGYTIQHEGRCGRCGRPLTNPASLDTGLGPECAAALGVEWAEQKRRQPALHGLAAEGAIGGVLTDTNDDRFTQ